RGVATSPFPSGRPPGPGRRRRDPRQDLCSNRVGGHRDPQHSGLDRLDRVHRRGAAARQRDRHLQRRRRRPGRPALRSAGGGRSPRRLLPAGVHARRLDPDWALLVGEATGRTGADIHRRQARSGSATPMSRRRRLTLIAIVLVVVAAGGAAVVWLGDVSLPSTAALKRQGYLGALLLLYLEESGLPLLVPGDAFVLYVGYRLPASVLPWVAAWLALIAAVTLGATNLYLISRTLGRR